MIIIDTAISDRFNTGVDLSFVSLAGPEFEPRERNNIVREICMEAEGKQHPCSDAACAGGEERRGGSEAATAKEREGRRQEGQCARLTLDERVLLACAELTVLLSFHHTRIAGQQEL